MKPVRRIKFRLIYRLKRKVVERRRRLQSIHLSFIEFVAGTGLILEPTTIGKPKIRLIQPNKNANQCNKKNYEITLPYIWLGASGRQYITSGIHADCHYKQQLQR